MRGKLWDSSGVKIRGVGFRQSGGFAGLVKSCEVEGKTLSPAVSVALERHTRQATSVPLPSARDMLVYELQLDTDEGPMRLAFDEFGVPADLSAFVKALASRAKPGLP